MSQTYNVSLTWNIVAAAVSFALNHSIGWGLLHGFLGGFYVMYSILFRWQEWGTLIKGLLA